jgi:hypothetical protein
VLDIPGRWGRIDAFGRGRVDVAKHVELRQQLGDDAPAAPRRRARTGATS